MSEHELLVWIGGVGKSEISLRIDFPHGFLHFEVTKRVVGGEEQVINKPVVVVAHFEVADKFRNPVKLLVIQILERRSAVTTTFCNLNCFFGSERLGDVFPDALGGMCEPSVDRVHHECDQHFTFALGEESLYECIRDTGESEWVYKRECWCDAVAAGVKFVEEFAEFLRECSIDYHDLEMRR